VTALAGIRNVELIYLDYVQHVRILLSIAGLPNELQKLINFKNKSGFALCNFEHRYFKFDLMLMNEL
jgi:hypothetical protein